MDRFNVKGVDIFVFKWNYDLHVFLISLMDRTEFLMFLRHKNIVESFGFKNSAILISRKAFVLVIFVRGRRRKVTLNVVFY